MEMFVSGISEISAKNFIVLLDIMMQLMLLLGILDIVCNLLQVLVIEKLYFGIFKD